LYAFLISIIMIVKQANVAQSILDEICILCDKIWNKTLADYTVNKQNANTCVFWYSFNIYIFWVCHET